MKTVLDNHRIAVMTTNGELVGEFPFLTLKVEHTACCGRVTGHSPDYDNIRKAIASLPPEKKVRFKELLKTESVTLHYNDATGAQTVSF